MGPRAPLGVPVRNPLLNLRLTSFNERMRPVPVVFLLLAFSPQLTVSLHVRIGVLGMEEVCRFEVCGGWGVDMCRRDVDSCFVVGLQGIGGGVVIGGEVCIGSERTLSDASAGVAAVGAGVLLDVERARACILIIPSAFLWIREIGGRRRSVVVGEKELHTAASAQNVRLVVALAERSSTLGCAQSLVSRSVSLDRIYGRRLTHFEVSTVRLAVRGSVVGRWSSRTNSEVRILTACHGARPLGGLASATASAARLDHRSFLSTIHFANTNIFMMSLPINRIVFHVEPASSFIRLFRACLLQVIQQCHLAGAMNLPTGITALPSAFTYNSEIWKHRLLDIVEYDNFYIA